MSKAGLHDLLAQLKQERTSADIVDGEYQQLLDEIVESLEQQQLYPDSFDQYSSLTEQVKNIVIGYQEEHPEIKRVLNSVHQLLVNFSV